MTVSPTASRTAPPHSMVARHDTDPSTVALRAVTP